MGTASTSACAIRPSFIDGAAASSDMDIDQLVAAFVRIRGVDRLEGAVMTRCWLAADMGVPVASLDGLLEQPQGVGLTPLQRPNAPAVVVGPPNGISPLLSGELRSVL